MGLRGLCDAAGGGEPPAAAAAICGVRSIQSSRRAPTAIRGRHRGREPSSVPGVEWRGGSDRTVATSVGEGPKSVVVSKVGHVVLRVRDLDRSLAFYFGDLGLREVARRDFGEGPMAFLSSGNSHHDIALDETGVDGRRGTPCTTSR